jgi:hypothetical protein
LGKTIWDKTEVLLGTCWGTNWELGEPFDKPHEKLMGTLWEQEKKTKKRNSLMSAC